MISTGELFMDRYKSSILGLKWLKYILMWNSISKT